MRGFTSGLGTGSARNSSATDRNTSYGTPTTRNTYTPPAPVYYPPAPTAPRWEPEPVYYPPAPTAPRWEPEPTAPSRGSATARPTPAPAPAPIKSTVQKIIESAIAPKPAVTQPTIDPITQALTGQNAQVKMWQPNAKLSNQPGSSRQLTPSQESQVFDAQLQAIKLAQAAQGEPGLYFPDSAQQQRIMKSNAAADRLRAAFESPGESPLALWQMEQGSTPFDDYINTLTNSLTNGVSPIGDAGADDKNWSPPGTASPVYGDGTGGPGGMQGAWVNMGDGVSWVPNASDPGFILQNEPGAPVPPTGRVAPNDGSSTMSPDGSVLVWDSVTGLPTRVYPGNTDEFYAALGVNNNPDPLAPFWENIAALYEASVAGQNAVYESAGDGGYGYGDGGYGYGDGGYGYGDGGGGGYGYGDGGGGGGGGGGGSVGGLPIGDVGSAMEGWAARYLPATADEVLQNPQVIGMDTLADLGIDSDQLAAVFGDQAGYIVNQLLPFLFANTPVGQTPNISSVINKVHDVLKGMATPGGETFDVAKLLELLFAQAGNADAKNGATTMSGLFSGLSPSEYAAAMQGMVNNVSNWAPTPFFGQAIRNWYGNQQTNYLSDALRALNPEQRNLGEILRGSAFPGAS